MVAAKPLRAPVVYPERDHPGEHARRCQIAVLRPAVSLPRMVVLIPPLSFAPVSGGCSEAPQRVRPGVATACCVSGGCGGILAPQAASRSGCVGYAEESVRAKARVLALRLHPPNRTARP